MMPAAPDPAPSRPQDGPVAATRRGGRWTLRFQLTAFLALSIALVIGTTTYLQFRVVEGTLDTELVDAARLTALAVADDLELRRGPFDPEEIRRHLQEFIDTAPELGSISVVTLDHGQPVLFASTSSAGRTDALEVGRRAIARRDIVWGNPTGPVRVLAVPLTRDQRTFGAVAVTVSFDALYRLRDRGRVIAAWSTVLSVLALFVLVEFLVRWFIHRPIDAIRATMRHVTGGTLSARTPVLRDDEIGAVASGLNHMLAEMEELHGGLQQRVGQATQEIRARNRELLELYRQMSQLREELGRAQQLAAVGETASAVAHQIGTPLNLVSGHIQLLMEGLDPASPVARRLQVAEEQLHKVTAIVQDLLARSRRPLQREPVDLDLLLRRLCALVKPVHDTAGVRLTYEGAPVPAVDADAAQLELALLNLVSNAIDAMPAGGELVIRLAAADSHATISVSDTGTGMPPDLVERAFEPWVTTKPVGRGTGLGLSITRSVIVDHGGSVAVRSAVGRGTTVTVTLPLASAATPPKTNHA